MINLIGILIFVAIVIPSVEGILGFDIGEGITLYFVEIIFFVILFLFAIRKFIEGKIKKVALNLPVLSFLTICILFSIYGAYKNGLRASLYDLRPLLYYSFYFVVINTVKTRKQIIKLINPIFIGTVVYCFVIISMYLWDNNPLCQLIQWQYSRASFSNSINILFIFPLILSGILIRRNFKNNIISLLGLFLFSFTIIISQSRTLWLVSIGTIILLVILLRRNRSLKLNRLITSLIILSFLFIFIISLVVMFSKAINYDLYSQILKRAYSLRHLTSISEVQSRLISFENVSNLIKESPVIGKGMGKRFIVIGDIEGIYVDSSFLTLLIKMGLVGLFFFLWVYIKILKELYWGFYNSKNDFSLIFYPSLIVSFLGLLIVALQNVVLLKGKHIFVIAVLMGLIEVNNRLIKKDKFSVG